MVHFIKGRLLNAAFFNEAVLPLLSSRFPSLRFSAALIGPGSDVLGFDTARSMDHDWGPKLAIFLPERGFAGQKAKISAYLGANLPPAFKGFSTSFSSPDERGTRVMKATGSGPVSHGIRILTIRSFFSGYLGIDPLKEPSPADWLALSEQKLLSIREAEIFHDDLGLGKIAGRLRYYPQDVWLYLLASQWMRISQEEAFMGRCGELSDEIGSRIIAARLVRDIMRLCFLMEKEYCPYSKWFGTAFSRLRSAKKLAPILKRALASGNWKGRERALSEAYGYVAKLHNSLGITKSLPAKVSRFHDRPFKVIHADVFSSEIRKRIRDKTLKTLPLIGSINQFSDSTDVMKETARFRKIFDG